jgi:hypothetical protein
VVAAAGRLSAGAGRGREREIKKRKITFAVFSSHFLISSSEIKSSPAYGRQRSAAGSKRPGAYLSVLLCFGTGKRAGEKGKETTIKLFFAGASFFFNSPSLSFAAILYDLRQQQQQTARTHLHRSHGRQRAASGNQRPGAWFSFQSLFVTPSLPFFTFSLSLSHTFFFPRFPFLFKQNTARPRLCDAYGGKFHYL